jgi:hypothetical protein
VLTAKSKWRGTNIVVGITVALLFSFGLLANVIVMHDHNTHREESSIVQNHSFIVLIFGVICLVIAGVVILASLFRLILIFGDRVVAYPNLQRSVRLSSRPGPGSRTPGVDADGDD